MNEELLPEDENYDKLINTYLEKAFSILKPQDETKEQDVAFRIGQK